MTKTRRRVGCTKMNIDGMICRHCSGVVTDISTVKQNSIIGIYFQCSYCKGINAVSLNEDRVARIEKSIELSSPQKSLLERMQGTGVPVDREEIDDLLKGIDEYTEPGKFVVTAFDRAIDVDTMIDGFETPCIVIDLDGFEANRIRRIKHDGLETFDLSRETTSKKLEKLYWSLVTVSSVASSSNATPIKTVVITTWDEVLKACSEYIGKMVGSRTLAYHDFAVRNDIIDFLIRMLQELNNDGVAIHIFSKMNVCNHDRDNNSVNIPNHLLYASTKTQFVRNGEVTVMRES